MPRHYLGLYTTWPGVVYEAEMHGDTGIGTAKLPKVTPEIALWGYAEVYKGEELITKAAPAHIMVMENEPIKGIMLEVETEGKGLLGTPDGYLNVLWPEISSIQLPEKRKAAKRVDRMGSSTISNIIIWLVGHQRRIKKLIQKIVTD